MRTLGSYDAARTNVHISRHFRKQMGRFLTWVILTVPMPHPRAASLSTFPRMTRLLNYGETRTRRKAANFRRNRFGSLCLGGRMPASSAKNRKSIRRIFTDTLVI